MAVKLFGLPRELHGSRARANGALNLALVAEGYTEAEHQAQLFWNDADKVVQELRKTAPFSTFLSLVNVFGVPAISPQSAQLIATRCPAQAEADRQTAFKVQFCVNNSPRSIKGDEALVKQVVRVDAGLPFVDQLLVIVNSKLYGGFGPTGVGWVTTSDPGWPRTAVHELGHSAFGLTDEYEDDEPGDPPTPYTGAEPSGPNVTASLALPTFKWRSLVQSFMPWPSTVPSGGPCTFNHPRAPGVAADAIGAFEGGAHRACNVYRPAFQCKMREHTHRFCAVCAREIVPTMSTLTPPPDWSLFSIRGLAATSLLLALTVSSPVVGDVVEDVVLGIDEDANAVWAVEQRAAGVALDTTPPDRRPVIRSVEPLGTIQPSYEYLPSIEIPRHWHPYLVREMGGERWLVQGRLADLTTSPATLRPAPLTDLLHDPDAPPAGPAHRLDPCVIPSEGRRLERRWVLGRRTDGTPVLWSQRRHIPLLAPPVHQLRFDVLDEAPSSP